MVQKSDVITIKGRIKMRICRICGVCKSIEEFSKFKNGKDGIRSECKDCKRQMGRAYREKNIERLKANEKIYREKNKEVIKERVKKSVKKREDHYIAVRKKYTEEHREEKRKASRTRYWANRERLLKEQKIVRDTIPERRMLAAAKSRSKQSNIDFDLSIEDIVIPKICPILGLILLTSNFINDKHSPSLDRLDNLKGYVKENSWVISSLANTMKNDAKYEDLVLFAKWIVGESIFSTERQSVNTTIMVSWHSNIKYRSKRDGVKFDITPEDLYIPNVCPVFGKVLSKSLPSSHKFRPSVDRIVPENGYTKNNIQIISKQANTMKNRATKLELFSFAGWVFKEFAPDYLTQGATKAILIHTLMQDQLQEEAQKLL